MKSVYWFGLELVYSDKLDIRVIQCRTNNTRYLNYWTKFIFYQDKVVPIEEVPKTYDL